MPDRFSDPHDPRSLREGCMDDIRATITAATKRRLDVTEPRLRRTDNGETPKIAPRATGQAGITPQISSPTPRIGESS